MQYFTSLEYLMIDVANNYGLDKKTWGDRLAWFCDRASMFLSSPMEEILTVAKDAKEPAQFVAGIMAYREAMDNKPIGYACSLDATASGLQILSALSGCKQSAKTCNLINYDDDRKDAYQVVYEEMQRRLGTDNPICPDRLKKAVMTHLYGSKRQPKNAFGEDTPELDMFYKVLDDTLPGANALNKDLLALWNPEAYSHDWTLPDGFKVQVKVMDTVEHEVTFLGETYVVPEKVNMPMQKGLSLGANIVHSIDGMVVREMGRRCNFDPHKSLEAFMLLFNKFDKEKEIPYCAQNHDDLSLVRAEELWKQTKFCSLVAVEYINKQNISLISKEYANALLKVMRSTPDMPFPILAVHDCFRFHPNYGNDVRQQYINIMAEIAESDILSSIASQLRGRTITVNKKSNDLGEYIRKAEYPLS